MDASSYSDNTVSVNEDVQRFSSSRRLRSVLTLVLDLLLDILFGCCDGVVSRSCFLMECFGDL